MFKAKMYAISIDAPQTGAIPLHHFTIIIIIFDMVVTQKRNFILNTKNYEFISFAILRLSQHHQGFCAARLHTSTVGNVKIARSERSYYCYIHMLTFHIPPLVWLLRNLSLGGKLCLGDDKNTAFVHHPLPLQASMEKVTKCARISRKLFLIG